MDEIAPEANQRALRVALEALMGDDRLRESMADAARRCGRPDAADSIAEHLLQTVADALPSRASESLQALC